MILLGHMRPSRSNYTSPLNKVLKMGTMKWQPVGDYRVLNAPTEKEKYPIPCIADFMSDLRRAKVFSHIDLTIKYSLIRMIFQKRLFVHSLGYLKIHECNSDYVMHEPHSKGL
ncbi:transposon Ty3-I Gag-Pol polyprotein [Trichonephila clavipes]|nr:transposon Ty3-I Gag-Pol polyprotein [Trichonephila clavipes]